MSPMTAGDFPKIEETEESNDLTRFTATWTDEDERGSEERFALAGIERTLETIHDELRFIGLAMIVLVVAALLILAKMK